MRRCRLDIGDKVQAEIIDNLKPSLYQTTPKHTENCVHEYLINSHLFQAEDL